MCKIFFQRRRKAWRVALAWMAGLCMWLGNDSAWAILVGASRFDQMVTDSDVIVTFTITETRDAPSEQIAFSGTVGKVIKTDGQLVADELVLEAPGPAWPSELGLSQIEGQIVILFLKRYEGSLHIAWHMNAILPTVEDAAEDSEADSPERRVICGLRGYLETLDDGIAKARVLALIGHLAERNDLDLFLCHMDSADTWVRQAARMAAARVDSQPDRIQAVVADIMEQMARPEDDWAFWEIHADIKWAARCGAFGMEASLVARAQAYLPIYRALLDYAPPNYGRQNVGIEGLQNVGTSEDVERLWRFRTHPDAWVRHDVLEGVGRILGHPVKPPHILSYDGYVKPDVVEWERTTMAELEPLVAAANAVRENP